MREFVSAALLAALALNGCTQGGEEAKGQAPVMSSSETADCYDSKLNYDAPEETRALFVILDQTSPLDSDLSDSINKSIQPLLVPGTHLAVYTFSALTSEHRAKQVFEADLQQAVPEKDRPSLAVPRLKKLDRCLRAQAENVRSEVGEAIESSFDEPTSDFANSEILKSLEQVSKAVQSARQKQKFVVLASDMIEHSKNIDFYTKRTLRVIDPAKELAKVEGLDLISDFDGATVAVIGAGLISDDAKKGEIRDEKALKALRSFWQDWFEASNGRMAAYGEPELLETLSWGDGTK